MKKLFRLFQLLISFRYSIAKTSSLLTLSVLLFSEKTVAQIIPAELKEKVRLVDSTMQRFCDSTERDLAIVRRDTRVATSGSYKKYIDAYFTYLSYDRGTLPTGTSASLDLASNSTQLKLSLARKMENITGNGSILLATAGVQAKIENGVSNLFNGGTAATGTTFFGNFALLPRRASYRVRYIVSEFENGVPVTSPYAQLHRKKLTYHAAFCIKQTEDYYLKYNAMICRWEEIKGLLKDCNPECCDQYALIKEKDEIEKELEVMGLIDKKPKQLADAPQNAYLSKLYDMEIESGIWQWVQFFWVSGGITYTRESYDTYDQSLNLAKRFDSKNFGAVGGRIAFHWFKEKFSNYRLIGSNYFNISYASTKINTYTGIKAQDYARNILQPSNPPDTTIIVQLVKKAKNITNKKFETGWRHSFSMNYTAMFWKNQNMGINLRPEVQVADFSMPVYNAHIGILIRLKNNNHDPADKKSKAKVNFEPFIDLLDIADAGGSGKSVWKNSVIGINTTLPFSKIFFD